MIQSWHDRFKALLELFHYCNFAVTPPGKFLFWTTFPRLLLSLEQATDLQKLYFKDKMSFI